MTNNSVETDQTHTAKTLLFLNDLASTMGDHRKSYNYFKKIEELSDEVVDKLANIVLEEL